MGVQILIAVEDEPSFAASLKLLKRSPYDDQIQKVWPQNRQGGYPGIVNRIDTLNAAAKFGHRVLVLTDLDENQCAPTYRQWWENNKGLVAHPNLIFRIAVKEVEAWALADSKAFAAFFCISEKNITTQPESLSDPKAHLLNLLRGSKSRDIREGCIPAPNQFGKMGPDYNDWLKSFFLNHWSPHRAAKNSNSLKSAISRIRHWV